MTTYYSINTSTWADTTAWSTTPGGGSAGASPGASDKGVVTSGYKITIGAPLTVGSILVSNGTLIINSNITYTDAAPIAQLAHLVMDTSASNAIYSTAATSSNPLTIASASATPTFGVLVFVYSIAGPETRTFNLDYFTIKNLHPVIGDQSLNAFCNFPNVVNSVWFDSVDPIERDTSMVENVILGRDHSRVYRLGDNAGTCTVIGHCNWDSMFPTLIRQLKAGGGRVCMVWDRVVMPFARIEGVPKFTPKRGSLRIDFSITLVEDS